VYRVSGQLTGVAPLLINRYTGDPGKGPGGKTSEKKRWEEAKQKAYRGNNGLYLPSWTFKRVLLDGCGMAGMKRDARRGLSKYLEASVFVEGDLLFGKHEPDFYHEAMGRIPPRTGGYVPIIRPALETGWQLPFRLVVLDDTITEEQVRWAMEEAGVRAGIGAWRPEYGRFVVSEWSRST